MYNTPEQGEIDRYYTERDQLRGEIALEGLEAAERERIERERLRRERLKENIRRQMEGRPSLEEEEKMAKEAAAARERDAIMRDLIYRAYISQGRYDLAERYKPAEPSVGSAKMTSKSV